MNSHSIVASIRHSSAESRLGSAPVGMAGPYNDRGRQRNEAFARHVARRKANNWGSCNHSEESLMMRMFAAAAALLFIGVGALLADELKGKVKSVDTEKMQLVVTDDSGKEQTVTIGK